MRLVDADEFEVVGTKIPDGMDAESYMAGMDFVLNKIDDAPTIEPERKEIIYCKECKYYRTEDCYIHIERLWELKPTDYCSQAERN